LVRLPVGNDWLNTVVPLDQYNFETHCPIIKWWLKNKSFYDEQFDMHATQVVSSATGAGTTANQLPTLSKAIKAFMDDTNILRIGDNVVLATFSEFCRKAKENGIKTGVTGANVDLSPVNIVNGQITKLLFNTPQNDYRQAFTTILQDWLSADATTINAILYGSYLTRKMNIFNNCNSFLGTNSVGVDVPVRSGLQDFKATGILVGTNIISGNGTKVNFKARQSVTLNSGFSANNGTVFAATVEGCANYFFENIAYLRPIKHLKTTSFLQFL
jgi:hypothetical protein